MPLALILSGADLNKRLALKLRHYSNIDLNNGEKLQLFKKISVLSQINT